MTVAVQAMHALACQSQPTWIALLNIISITVFVHRRSSPTSDLKLHGMLSLLFKQDMTRLQLLTCLISGQKVEHEWLSEVTAGNDIHFSSSVM